MKVKKWDDINMSKIVTKDFYTVVMKEDSTVKLYANWLKSDKTLVVQGSGIELSKNKNILTDSTPVIMRNYQITYKIPC